MANKNIPLPSNPMPPPPKTPEGQAWADYHFKYIEAQEGKKENSLLPILVTAFVFTCIFWLFIFIYFN